MVTLIVTSYLSRFPCCVLLALSWYMSTNENPKKISWVGQSTVAISYFLLSSFLIYSRVIFTQWIIVRSLSPETIYWAQLGFQAIGYIPSPALAITSWDIVIHTCHWGTAKLEQLQPKKYSALPPPRPPFPLRNKFLLRKGLQVDGNATLPCLRTIYENDFGKNISNKG